ncbi:hypothetical protein FOMPIDRAFT_83325 [Fomitopsis schrenkii]|uniref:Uncharacterized protein n=1 Tax=Fomitopsis schrenkii TaxID=2126942 RepID=S8FIS4_FOMSC|nr:hypothetical protein FOMPIDRAFT_83325 [Fomitopsis schrenkii]
MPAAPRRQTRETNKGKHPGEIQILADLEAAAEDPRARLKRRSAIEVAAAKKAQDDAQQAAVAAQQAAIQKVARIQHQKKHADDNDMTSPATLPPRFRTKGLAAVVPKAAVNSNARWIPDALLSDNEDDSDVLAVGDEDRTDADEVQVDGQAICTGVQQPESTAVTAAFDNNQDGAHVANMTVKKTLKKGKKQSNKVHRSDVDTAAGNLAAFAAEAESEVVMPRTVISEAAHKRNSSKRKSGDPKVDENIGSSAAEAPAAKKQKPYTPSRGGVLAGWVQVPSSAVNKGREGHVNVTGHPPVTALQTASQTGAIIKDEDIDPVLRNEVPPALPSDAIKLRGTRNTAQGVVTVTIPNPAVVPIQPPVAVAAGGQQGGRRATLDVLPAQLRNAFLRVYTPQLLEVVGRLPNPWDLQDVDLSVVFQQIWDDVFPDNAVPQSFVPGSGPYRLCMQKIYDWRSSFGSNAIKAVRRIWDQEKLTTARERAHLADTAIGVGSPYLYGRVVFGPDGDVVKHSMRFQSTVILSALAGHFQAIEPHPMAGNPRGALLLCTTATERAWTIATAGTFDMKCLAFTEKLWSASVPLYLRAIQGLPDHSWFNINTVAMEIKKHSFAVAEVIEIDDDDEEVIYSDAETEVDSDNSMEVCAAVIKEVTRPRPIF